MLLLKGTQLCPWLLEAQFTPKHCCLIYQNSPPSHSTMHALLNPGAHHVLALTTKQKPIIIIFRVRGP